MLVAVALSGCSAAGDTPRGEQGVPRTADGTPNFKGVWAGPGFAHTGKDGRCDGQTVHRNQHEAVRTRRPGAAEPGVLR